MIQTAAREALAAWIEQNKPAIHKAIATTMQKESGKMALAFADGIVNAVKSNWNFKVDVNFNSKT